MLTSSTHPGCLKDGICLRYHRIGIIATLLLLTLPKTEESPHHCRRILGCNSAALGTNVWMATGGCHFFIEFILLSKGVRYVVGLSMLAILT